jgi:hypothetical protein
LHQQKTKLKKHKKRKGIEKIILIQPNKKLNIIVQINIPEKFEMRTPCVVLRMFTRPPFNAYEELIFVRTQFRPRNKILAAVDIVDSNNTLLLEFDANVVKLQKL